MEVLLMVSQADLTAMDCTADRLSELVERALSGGMEDSEGTLYLSDVRARVRIIDTNDEGRAHE